jgi:hypothetical protein
MVSATHVIKIYTYTGNMLVPSHMCNGFKANSVNNLPMLVNIHSEKEMWESESDLTANSCFVTLYLPAIPDRRFVSSKHKL